MHGGNLLEAKELYGREEFIDLSANINPFGPPEGVWKALLKSLKNIIHYPDPQYRRLRQSMAQKFNIPEETILLGNGAGELIYLLLHGLRPKKVLIPQPAFSEYERAARACGAEVNKVNLGRDGWRSLNIQNGLGNKEWKQSVEEADLIFLNSPHNPTGSVLQKEDFEVIIDWAKQQGTWIVLDESFLDFLEDGKRWSGKEYLSRYPNLVVLYSLTKFYALPGLRLGAAFAQPQVLKLIKEQQDPWAVNVLAEEAGIAALEDQEYEIRARQLLQESKQAFYTEFVLANLPELQLLPSDVNFALIQVTGGTDQDVQRRKIIRYLGQQGILVRDCSNFQGFEGEFMRVAIKDSQSMHALIEALRKLQSIPR